MVLKKLVAIQDNEQKQCTTHMVDEGTCTPVPE
jgi:hypothetical protein